MSDSIPATQGKRPIKVMHVIARLNIGGPAIYVIQLIAQLNQMGYHGQLVCGLIGKSEGDMRYLADEKNLPLTIIPSLGREISFVGDIATIYSLWRVMRRERPDIVHTHTAKAGFVGRLAARLAGVPVIVHTFHGHVFWGYFGPAKTRLFVLLEKFCAALSTRIITLSAGLKRELAEVYHVAPANRIEIIELGFELDKLAAVDRSACKSAFHSRYAIPPETPVIGIVGRLVPIKNHDLFLRAAKLTLEQIPDAHFAIVGDGEQRAELEALTRDLGIAERVHFAGWIADMPSVYGALDALVLCSNNEGLPVSLIEAMAAHAPVVATSVGGVPDLLDGGRLGAIVPPGDAKALAAAVIGILRDPATHQQVEMAHDAALERYSIRHSAACTDSLYQTLLQERHVH